MGGGGAKGREGGVEKGGREGVTALSPRGGGGSGDGPTHIWVRAGGVVRGRGREGGKGTMQPQPRFMLVGLREGGRGRERAPKVRGVTTSARGGGTATTQP
ncbi:hypothetical protein TIFTF001_055089 [Ficus carica]|uniref:Uncharacterized protein n=1 Tax=Ficus carica TaxID=3494 RepID=A0AA88JG79_FICCA|nr:hypothetical protein TIFTF001_055089 [Ficus carica]